MTERRETPDGFLKHAQEFWQAANLVLSEADDDVSLPAYFLLGRSIELSLKAYLLHCGVPTSELRKKKYGHNLRSLLGEARTHGIERYIELEAIDSGIIGLLSYDYEAKRLEYRVTKGIYALPLLQPTVSVARRLAYELSAAWE